MSNPQIPVQALMNPHL